MGCVPLEELPASQLPCERQSKATVNFSKSSFASSFVSSFASVAASLGTGETEAYIANWPDPSCQASFCIGVCNRHFKDTP